eukprot:UN31530
MALAKDAYTLDEKSYKLEKVDCFREETRDMVGCYHDSVENVILVAAIVMGGSFEFVTNGTFPDEGTSEWLLIIYVLCLISTLFSSFWSIFWALQVKHRLLDFTLAIAAKGENLSCHHNTFPLFWKKHCNVMYKLSEFFYGSLY